MKSKTFTFLKVLIIIYCAIGIALYYLQDKFLLHPEWLAPDHKYAIDKRYEEVNIAVNNDEKIHFVKVFPDTTRKGIILYFHGNNGNIDKYYPAVKSLVKKEYEVWLYEYPGFGKAGGTFTEDGIYAQASQLFKLALAQTNKDSIIVYGRSFGCGVASYISSFYDPRLLILETPYYNIPKLYAHYAPVYPMSRMANYDFPVYKYLEDVKRKVVIFHGDDDAVIPYKQSLKLKQYLKTGDEFISIKNGEHNNLYRSEVFIRSIDSLFN